MIVLNAHAPIMATIYLLKKYDELGQLEQIIDENPISTLLSTMILAD